MKPFFSIIVPCCDVEAYLRESLDSVLNQPFADWECILGVEDSKDGTLEIARDYEKRDSRFSVFTGQRSGSCSASRNTGLDRAVGEYVIFLDGDDTIAEGSLQRIHDKIAERPGADIYPCAMQVRSEITGEDIGSRDNYPADFTGELAGPAATLMIYNRNRAPCPMLQLSVFRRKFLTDNNLKCLYGRKRQDSEFAPRALYLASRVIPLHETFYIYRVRENSISMLAKKTDYFLDDYAEILKSLFYFHSVQAAKPGFDARISSLWARHWLTWICYYWFAPRVIRNTQRKRRVETLRKIFPDGFAPFDRLCRVSSFPRRVAGLFIKLSVSHPSLAWIADAFFLGVYYPLTGVRDTLRDTLRD